MPTQLKREVRTLASEINHKHGIEVTTLACLIHLTSAVFTDLGARTDTNIRPLIAAQQRYLDFWMVNHGIRRREVDAAISALGQAGATVRYLSAIPA